MPTGTLYLVRTGLTESDCGYCNWRLESRRGYSHVIARDASTHSGCPDDDSVGRVLAVIRTVCEQQLHVLRYVRVKARYDMAVRIEGDGDRAVPEHLLHNLGVNTALKQLGRRSVTQIVDTDLWQASVTEGFVEDAIEVAPLDRAAILVGKHEIVC